MDKDVMQTGTTTMGIVCKEGVVLAADMRATAGHMIVDKRAQKVFLINDNIAVTIAGTVSDAQLIVKLFKAELNLKNIRTGFDASIKESANLLAGLIYGNIRKMSLIPGISHFVLGGKDEEGYHLYDVFPDGSLTHVRDYVSSGSGSVFAYGVLESSFKKDMSIDEGAKLAVKAINAALQRDSASGNGINIVTVTKDGAKQILTKELNQLIEV